MNRQYARSRRSLDHTLLTALNIIMTLGGATAIYHWISVAEMDPAAAATVTATTREAPAAEQRRGS